MSNSYIGYHFTIEPKELGSEILIAELGEKAFESFTETETGIDAFVQKELWDATILDGVYILQSEEFNINYTFEEIEQINWNEEWEKTSNRLKWMENVMFALHSTQKLKQNLIS